VDHEPTKSDNPNTLADVYAIYRNGVHEFSMGMRTSNGSRFLMAVMACSLTAIAIALVVKGYPLYAVGLGIAALGGVGAMAVLRNNVKTSEKPTDKSVDVGPSSDREEPPRRIAG
jgi:hypothetical protein